MKKIAVTPATRVFRLATNWSFRAKKLFLSIPNGGNATILDLYHWHWLHHGKDKYRGFSAAPDFVGLRTYEEFRAALIGADLPDLSNDMFSSHTACSECCSRDILQKVLDEWPKAGKRKMAHLRKEICECSECDGH